MKRTTSNRISKVLLLGIAFTASAVLQAFPSFSYHVIEKRGSKGGGTSLVDVDNDGDLDLLFPYRGRGHYHWFEYKNADKWVKHTIGKPTDTDVGGSAADIDGDGKKDAVTCKKWFRNLGNGKWEKHEYGGSTGNHDVVCADINGDKKKDIVCQKGGAHLEWYRNPGKPTENHKWPKKTIGKGIHGGTAPRGVGDLDGDGDNDVIRGDVWFENRDGKGAKWRAHKIDHNIPPSRFSGGLAVRSWICDINGDEKNDFVIAGCDIPNGPVLWYEGDGNGAFSKHTVAKDLNNDFHSLSVADFDNDGDPDICAGGAVLGKVKNVYIFENTNGKGRFKRHNIAEVKQSHEMCAGDVDGDGDIDVCSKGWGSDPVFFLENKSSTTVFLDNSAGVVNGSTAYDPETRTCGRGEYRVFTGLERADTSWRHKYRRRAVSLSEWKEYSGKDRKSVWKKPRFKDSHGDRPEDFQRTGPKEDVNGSPYSAVCGAYVTGKEVIGCEKE